ncbi:MAG: pyridoxal phosphate-dependent aminotransferase [Microscillaceae bacterium]|nr:pyridoxal phosphate-dependent aminotransferase [Microscillaceae bacterium]MDW8459866.1 pyridoxal phosphate-dependent aminotransferase [Cytophagales bacterium]
MSTLASSYSLLSQRVNALAESQTIAMAKKARELMAQGHKIIKLDFGEPDFQTPTHIKEAAKKAIDEGYTFYTPVAGIPELRKAIAEKLSRENRLAVKAENIIVSTGAKQALINALLCLVNPGDEVIIFTPYWVSYSEMVKLAEGVPVLLEGKIENNFKVTPQQLAEALTERTRVVLYSSPSNPTGTVYTADELEAFTEVLAPYEHVFVIADEIYEYITFLPTYTSIGSFANISHRVVTINGFSKGFAMTGWRVGYMAGPKWLADACDKLQGQFTSGTCSIAQRAALAAITSDLTPTLEMRNAFLRRRNLVASLIQEIEGWRLYVPDGAFYVFPYVGSHLGKAYQGQVLQTDDELCMFLLNEAHVSTVPGSAFGAPGFIRISFAASDEDLKEAFVRIKQALAKLQ